MGLVFFGLDKREIYNLFQEFHVFTLAKFLKVIIAKPGVSKNALEMSCLCLSCNSFTSCTNFRMSSFSSFSYFFT